MQPGVKQQNDPREARIENLKLAAGLYAQTPLYSLAMREVFALRAQQLQQQTEQGRTQ